ncbi:hypothetical protein D3C87_1829830 [compost metagenome]
MLPEYRLDLGIVQHTAFNHLECATSALFGRLQDEDYGAIKLIAHTRQNLRCPQEHCDMRVVTAGMHDSNLLAVQRRDYLRPEGQIILLGNRQSIHIGT